MIRLEQAQYTGMTTGLGWFKVCGHPKQVRAAADLRHHFLETRGSPDLVQLREQMHLAFDSLLRCRDLEEVRMGSPTDQVLFLLSLVGEGHFISSNRLQSLCSALQFCFRCILVQIARLRSVNSTSYLPWVHPSYGESHDGVAVMDEDIEDVYENDSADEDLPSDFEAAENQSTSGMFLASTSGKTLTRLSSLR